MQGKESLFNSTLPWQAASVIEIWAQSEGRIENRGQNLKSSPKTYDVHELGNESNAKFAETCNE